jgi:hypothetical protein
MNFLSENGGASYNLSVRLCHLLIPEKKKEEKNQSTHSLEQF